MPTPAVQTIPATARQVIIVANPKAGASDQSAIVSELADRLRQRELDVLVHSDIEQVRQDCQTALHNGQLRAVIAAGGDGTAGLVANIVPAGCPIGLLPLGTENLLARYFQVQADPQQLCETIAQGKQVQIDLGRANGQTFLIMASAGFDADVVKRLHDDRTGHIHHLSYAKPIWKSIRKYEYPELRVYYGDQPQPIQARWSFVFNFPCYAMRLPIVADADGFDGQLDLCTFRRGSLLQGLVYLLGVMARRHRLWRDVQHRRTVSLRIESDEKVPYQIDGDPGGFLPLNIEVLPRHLGMLVSDRWLQLVNS